MITTDRASLRELTLSQIEKPRSSSNFETWGKIFESFALTSVSAMLFPKILNLEVKKKKMRIN